MTNNSQKNNKKSTKHLDEDKTKQLAKLGIFQEDEDDIIDEEDQEFWRDYI